MGKISWNYISYKGYQNLMGSIDSALSDKAEKIGSKKLDDRQKNKPLAGLKISGKLLNSVSKYVIIILRSFRRIAVWRLVTLLEEGVMLMKIRRLTFWEILQLASFIISVINLVLMLCK
ncbi:MAG: hypothetical protein LUE88_00570 [Clostridiales bacterium]|nr:hypothetical protein [Clostridiales bacterium]